MKLIITGDGTVQGTRVVDEDGVQICNARVLTTKIDSRTKEVDAKITFLPVPPINSPKTPDGRPTRFLQPQDLEDDPITEISLHTRIQTVKTCFGIGHAPGNFPVL